MNDMQEVDMKSILHYMLKSAFIEIRASNSNNASRKFADVFHILPMALLTCSTDEDYQAEYLRLLERAKQRELDRYIENLRTVATDSLKARRQSGPDYD